MPIEPATIAAVIPIEMVEVGVVVVLCIVTARFGCGVREWDWISYVRGGGVVGVGAVVAVGSGGGVLTDESIPGLVASSESFGPD